MDLVKRLEEYRDRERELQWEGTFAHYFEIATKKPEVTRLAHERIYHMIMDADVETTRSGEPRYNFFSEEIFGIEKPLQQIVEYFHSAAQRLEVRKRILLLMGPVGGGKSTIIKIVLGLLKPDSGQVLIDGEDITNYTEFEMMKVRKKIAKWTLIALLVVSLEASSNSVRGQTKQATSQHVHVASAKRDTAPVSPRAAGS